MPEPIALIASDCHIDELIWRDKPNLTGDAYFAFRQVIDQAVDTGLPLILAGDVVETLPANTPTSRTIEFIRKQLARVSNVYAIQGQHDKTQPGWLTACSNNKVDYDSEVVELGGRSFYFLNHRIADVAKDFISNAPAVDVLVAHQSWQEFMGTAYCEMSLQYVPSQIKMLISGDFHLWKQATYERPDPIRLLSPGATHMRNTSEPTSHYTAVLYDDLSLARCKLKSRIVIKTDILTEDDCVEFIANWDELLEQARDLASTNELPAEIQTPLLIINDHANTGSIYANVLRVVKNSAHSFYYSRKPKAGSGIVYSQSTPVVIRGESDKLSEYLAKECPENTPAYELLSSLFKSDDVRTALGQFKQEFLKNNAT